MNISVELHLLKRVKYIWLETTLSKEDRNINMKYTIKISRNKFYQSAELADDILISGSIASSCTSELLKNEF